MTIFKTRELSINYASSGKQVNSVLLKETDLRFSLVFRRMVLQLNLLFHRNAEKHIEKLSNIPQMTVIGS